MVTSTSNERCTTNSCPSLTSRSRISVFSKNSNNSFWCHKRRKEARSISLKPRKRYPLPLPKSVPHLPRIFFTEHLFINCVYNDESSVDLISELEYKSECLSERTNVNNRGRVSSHCKLPLSRPRIPAPDFKLRETRKIVAKRLISNIQVSRQKSGSRLESINILINCESKEKIKPKRPALVKTNRNKTDHLDAKKIIKVCNTGEPLSQTHCNSEEVFVPKNIDKEYLSDCKPYQITGQHLLKNKTIIKNTKSSFYNKITPSRQQTDPSFCNKSEKLKFFSNFDNIEVCHEEKSQFVCKESSGNNHLSYCEIDSLYCCNQVFDEPISNKQSQESNRFCNSFLPAKIKKETSFSSATKIFKKVGFTTLTFTKKVLNEGFFSVCNIIESYITPLQSKNIITERCSCITSAQSYSNDLTVLQATNNNKNLAMERTSVASEYSQGTKQSQESIRQPPRAQHAITPVAPSPSPAMPSTSPTIPSTSSEYKNTDKESCVCDCSCYGKAGRCRWKLFHHTNISESVFFGPTLDEAILQLMCCIRLIFEKLGLVAPKGNKASCCCCDGNADAIHQEEFSNNNLDVVKWLHDEYLILAKDLADANTALENNCPCTKDTCPVVLQSRRFVLDRLAELLEKKQEIESAYRKKEKMKKAETE